RALAAAEQAPSGSARPAPGVAAPGGAPQHRRVPARSEGDAGWGRGGGRRGDAGDDFEVDARRAHRLDLLGESAEDRRVTALEADDAATAAGAIDQQPVDLRLAHAVAARRLAGVDDLGLR